MAASAHQPATAAQAARPLAAAKPMALARFPRAALVQAALVQAERWGRNNFFQKYPR
jgi:hypothetical protein